MAALKMAGPNSSAVAALTLLMLSMPAAAQRLVEWTEAPGELGLGYPVPIPVDTPLPFDGFRTYDGLHTRHQDLMTQSPFLDGLVAGQTTAGRDIWIYILGDADDITPEGLPEAAMMATGNVHAREWQTPEVTTGIMEKFLEQSDDDFLYRYLLDHVQLVIIPVVNIDGLLQTQRFPTFSYLGSAGNSPRDGRMRRKNMNGVDEDIDTVEDHLLGVDLNRNNPPFWGSGNQNTANPTELTYRGTAAQSESEAQTLAASAVLGPEDRLRAYTDIHSFSQLNYIVDTANNRRNAIQNEMLNDFTSFELTLPGAKSYPQQLFSAAGSGIGATDEYFAETYQIPSWTLETEPRLGFGGVDYGGLGSNGGDGFILPESEISRVRDNLAQGFAVVWYHQAGPPSIAQVRLQDVASGAVVFDAEWDVIGPGQRQLHRNVIQPLGLDRDYTLWMSFDKPMRWRNSSGAVAPLPGQSVFNIPVNLDLELDGLPLNGLSPILESLDDAGGPPSGYRRYRDDASSGNLNLSSSANPALTMGDTSLTLAVDTRDLVGLLLDADPETAADWSDGHWINYEDSEGNQTDSGGTDRRIAVDVTDQLLPSPFLIEPGVSGTFFDISHDGEGFLIEVLDESRVIIFWFTYDADGNQRWFVGEGEIRGNEIVFTDLLVTSGGQFGPDFDPAAVMRERAGSASFLFRSCNAGSMKHDIESPRSRQDLDRLSVLTSIECGNLQPRTGGAAAVSGTWFDPSHDGEGFVVQGLADDRVLVFWFTYDADGNQAWIFGEGQIDGEGRVTINEALITSGGRFGDDFDPDQVLRTPWGEIEFLFACQSASMSYSSTIPAFGSGAQTLIRLSELPGLNCTQ